MIKHKSISYFLQFEYSYSSSKRTNEMMVKHRGTGALETNRSVLRVLYYYRVLQYDTSIMSTARIAGGVKEGLAVPSREMHNEPGGDRDHQASACGRALWLV